MFQSRAWILRWFLGLVLTQTIMSLAMAEEKKGERELCKAMIVVSKKLALKERIHFMRHNMPINFTIRVLYEEIFKLRNVSRLERNFKDQDIQDVDLQGTWFSVNLGVLSKIKTALPRRHPSYNYTSELESLLRNVQPIFEGMLDSERETPERIQQILDALADPLGNQWTKDTPKSLMDSCYHIMLCVFKSCFPSADYCKRSYWRDEKKALLQRLPQN